MGHWAAGKHLNFGAGEKYATGEPLPDSAFAKLHRSEIESGHAKYIPGEPASPPKKAGPPDDDTPAVTKPKTPTPKRRGRAGRK